MNPNWYHRSMPTVKEVKKRLPEVILKISNIQGVNDVYLCGSLADKEKKETDSVKDVDILVSTNFHSGDLMAIDDGPDSPMKMKKELLKDFGFHPKAVLFTKQFTRISECNLDHWVSSSDGKLLHWGIMPDNIHEWEETDKEAEKYASRSTGTERSKLGRSSKEKCDQWYMAYLHSFNQSVGNSKGGWFPSDHPASDLVSTSIKMT